MIMLSILHNPITIIQLTHTMKHTTNTYSSPPMKTQMPCVIFMHSGFAATDNIISSMSYFTQLKNNNTC